MVADQASASLIFITVPSVPRPPVAEALVRAEADFPNFDRRGLSFCEEQSSVAPQHDEDPPFCFCSPSSKEVSHLRRINRPGMMAL